MTSPIMGGGIPEPVYIVPASNLWSNPTAVNIGTTPTLIIAANLKRASVTIFNDSTNVLFIAKNSLLTATGATKGIPIPANSSYRTDFQGAIWGVYGTGSNFVPYNEQVFGQVNGLWEPSQTPGMFAWFNPDSLTLNDADLVTTLTDITGHGNSATSSGGNRPTFKKNIVGGKSMLQYLANSNYMQTPVWTALAQPNTIWLVAKSLDNTAGQVFFDGVNVANRHYMDSPAGGGSFRLNAGSTASIGSGSSLNWNVYTILFNGASSQIWINGVSIGTGNPGTNTLTGLTLGGNSTPGASFTGYQGQILLTTGDQTAYNAQNVAYLRAYYGI